MKNLFLKGKVPRVFLRRILCLVSNATGYRIVFWKFAKMFTPATLPLFRQESCSYFVSFFVKIVH